MPKSCRMSRYLLSVRPHRADKAPDPLERLTDGMVATVAETEDLVTDEDMITKPTGSRAR